jgi:hypothetical protein
MRGRYWEEATSKTKKPEILLINPQLYKNKNHVDEIH